MKLRKGAAVALVLLATCTEETREPGSTDIEPSQKALGKVPASEVATWQKVGSSSMPDGRYLQAVAYDETRKVLVMFGGLIFDINSYYATPSNETWEWSPATGKWTDRTAASAPEARSGAAMVFDSQRNKMVMFGGRAGSGLNLEDTWELDTATSTWTNATAAGTHPSARSQHAMVYEKSASKIFLFGGGRSDPYSYDGTGVSGSFGDVWELDPAHGTWTTVSPSTAPSPRHSMGAAWDSTRSKVVLFGGMQTEITGASGVPKQDTWEWDPASSTFTERTAAGNKPSQRYGHAMTFDSGRGRVLIFGGFDISTGGFLNDLWEWEPTSGTWSDRSNRSATIWPIGRLYASMVDVAGGRLEIVAGAAPYYPYATGGTGGSIIGPTPIGYGINGSREVWELDPLLVVFVDRTLPLDIPTPRSNHVMAYYPVTGKVYLFGGYDNMKGQAFGDLWEWNGTSWAQVTSTKGPSARSDAGLAYDPVRKSLILFGGTTYYGSDTSGETWEWTSTSGWAQLKPSASPDPMFGHGMVTDTVRGKILLFGGFSYQTWSGADAGGVPPKRDPMRNEVWEWDGAKLTWTNRTPTVPAQAPQARQYPALAFDEARQKLFLFDGQRYNWNTGSSTSSFWEWDTSTAGWALRDPGDWLDTAYSVYAVYDSIRRREVLFTDTGYNVGINETWELDARGPTWYVRSFSTAPEARSNAAMAFDSGRGVVVLFGGMPMNSPYQISDTWEYKVAKWGNGTGCTSAFAASCASGYCVEGVCCESSTCSGPCKSCNVAGSEGTCLSAKAGTEVPGSCDKGQACDGTGKCLSSNGQTCTSASTCASAYCVDGVCCENACTGTCVSCAVSGKAGKCAPYDVGTDPQNECGKGTGVCKSICDGVGSCVYPSSSTPCANCMACDGWGSCSSYDPYCRYSGGGGGTGGYSTGRGGSGGYTTGRGGSGGYTTIIPFGGTIPLRGGSGGTILIGGSGGAGGTTTARGGSGGAGGTTTARGGSGGTFVVIGTGGASTTTARGGSGGTTFVVIGTGGATTVVSGSGGTTTSDAGAGGKADGGSPKDGSRGGNFGGVDAITTARLHRSGCYCTLGRAAPSTAPELRVPLLAAAAALLVWRARRRRRR
jgi:hypothetical protein